MKLIFGREPAAITGAINALLAALIATHVITLTTEQSALLIAAVTAILGVYTAWAVVDTRLSVVVTAVKALLVLSVGFGLSLSADTLGVIMVAVTAVGSLWLRSQTSPADEVPVDAIPGDVPQMTDLPEVPPADQQDDVDAAGAPIEAPAVPATAGL